MTPRTRRTLAVAFSVLVVTATLTPATAGLEPPRDADSTNPLPDLDLALPLVDAIPGQNGSGTGNGNGNDNGKGNGGGRGPPQTTTGTATTTGVATTTTAGNDAPTTVPTTTRDPDNGNGPGNGNGNSGPPGGNDPGNPGQGPPGNRSENASDGPGGGSPETPGGGPPGNPGDGPPNDSGGGPPDEPGTGPPDDRGGGPPDDRGGGPPGNRGGGPPENRGGGPPGNRGGGPPDDRGGGPPENRGGGPPPWAGPPDADEQGERGPPEWVRSSETPPGLDGNRSQLAGNDTAANDSVFENATVNVTIEDAASAVDYRLAAIDALQTADFDGPGKAAAQHRRKALEALDDSLAYVLDANRTRSAELFALDKQASTPPWFAPNVTKLLVASDERLARTAIADARRVNATLQERNVSVDDAAVRENLSEATDAVERAERFRDRGQHHVAVTHYKVAWEHAQHALDVMDLATRPNVTITTRSDLPHEGNVTYRVAGRVFDVRAHELAPLTLSLNGQNRSVPLAVNTTPGAVGTFETNVTLTRQVNAIDVVATDPNRLWATEDDESDGGVNATTGVGHLRLDGDGLPDWYELNVTGTDPLDPDSNASTTASNEADNSVTDGAEDFDGDGETAYEAYRFGTDPLDTDTDGDGLRDGFELQFRGVDPLDTDTDNDSVPDAAEDLDNDTLSNAREQAEGTHPNRADTDGDALNDSAELANGTDPLARDTDEDGLNDSAELELGTDPTDPDTDSDGVLDGNETFTTSTENESVGAAVTISGEGDVAETVTITNESTERIQTETVLNASASEVLNFEADREFEQATLSIEYDESKVGDESDLAVYTYNESRQTYEKLPSEVNAANDTVTGTTPHFSTFVAMNESRWENYLQSPAKPDPNYVLEESFGNLSGWNCTGDCRVGGGQVVVGQEGGNAFTEEVSTLCQGPYLPDGSCPDSGDDDDSPDDGGGGSGGGGGTGSEPCITPYSEPDRCPGAGDGGGGGGNGNNSTEDGGGGADPPPQLGTATLERSISIPSDAVQVTVTGLVSAFAEEANASVEVAVSVGDETRTLVDLDGKDGERVFGDTYVDETVEMPSGDAVTFWVQTRNLSGASVDYVDITLKRDSDGDGLTNSLERFGIKTGDGDRVYTDPYDADTDGDGLSDGAEVAGYIPMYVDGGIFTLESDPTEADSDGDGVTDYEEQRVWQTDPFDADTDDDGLVDLVDRRPTVDSIAPNVKITSDIEYRENVSVAPPRNRNNYNDFVFVQVSDEAPITDFEVNGYYEPYVGDSFWKKSDYFKKRGTFQGTRNGYHLKSFAVPIYQHGVLDEDPERYYVNATDANGNKVAIEVRPQEPKLLPDVEFAGAVPFLGGIAATAGGEAVTGGVAYGSGISVTTATAVTAGGLVLVVGSAAAYTYDQRPAWAYESDYVAGQQAFSVPTAESVETYPAEETPFDEPVKLPSGAVYEPDVPVGDGHERGFGWEYVKRTPGINDYEDIGEVLDTPNPVDHQGNYDLVIGENPNGPGRIKIRLLEGTVISASTVIRDPQDRVIETPDEAIEHILNKDEWGHNQIGNTRQEVRDTIRQIINRPDEIYKHPRQNRLMYIKRMEINGKTLIVLAFVQDGKVSTAFVPTKETAYPGYTNQNAISYILDQLGMYKVYEKNKITPPDIGDKIT